MEILFGYDEGELIGNNVTILMDTVIAGMHDDIVASHVKSGQKKLMGNKRLLNGKHKQGNLFKTNIHLGELVETTASTVLIRFIAFFTPPEIDNEPTDVEAVPEVNADAIVDDDIEWSDEESPSPSPSPSPAKSSSSRIHFSHTKTTGTGHILSTASINHHLENLTSTTSDKISSILAFPLSSSTRTRLGFSERGDKSEKADHDASNPETSSPRTPGGSRIRTTSLLKSRTLSTDYMWLEEIDIENISDQGTLSSFPSLPFFLLLSVWFSLIYPITSFFFVIRSLSPAPFQSSLSSLPTALSHPCFPSTCHLLCLAIF